MLPIPTLEFQKSEYNFCSPVHLVVFAADATDEVACYAFAACVYSFHSTALQSIATISAF